MRNPLFCVPRVQKYVFLFCFGSRFFPSAVHNVVLYSHNFVFKLSSFHARVCHVRKPSVFSEFMRSRRLRRIAGMRDCWACGGVVFFTNLVLFCF